MRKMYLFTGGDQTAHNGLIARLDAEFPGVASLVLRRETVDALLSGPHRASDGNDHRRASTASRALGAEFFEAATRTRMGHGETVFLDPGPVGVTEIIETTKITRHFAYTLFVVDFAGDLDPASLSTPYPADISVITPEQVRHTLIEPILDLGAQARVVVLGDVQSCARSLNAILEATDARTADLVVFAGDLYDRGPDPASVYRTVRELEDQVPVIRVRGNHDKILTTLRFRPDTVNSRAARQPRETIRACAAEGIKIGDLADQDATTVSYLAFTAGGTEYHVTHGGAAYLGPRTPGGYASGIVAEDTLIYGENTPESTQDDRHSRAFDIDRHLHADHQLSGIVHVRGHSSVKGRSPDHFPGVYALESEVEFGSHLTALVIDGTHRSVVQVPGEEQVKGWNH